jgi:hypothetical protein
MNLSIDRTAVGVLIVGVVLGVLGIGGVRFALLPDIPNAEPVHYHANFAVFLDGERLDLSAMRYMEDLTTCKANPDVVLPAERAHMHEGVQDVVHVHHDGATWGHFFANVGIVLGDDFLVTDEGVPYFADPVRTMKFLVDGEQVTTLFNRVIVSEERLLISLGDETVAEVLETQFLEIPSTAASFNQYHQDPGGCSVEAPEEETTGQRLQRAFSF